MSHSGFVTQGNSTGSSVGYASTHHTQPPGTIVLHERQAPASSNTSIQSNFDPNFWSSANYVKRFGHEVGDGTWSSPIFVDPKNDAIQQVQAHRQPVASSSTQGHLDPNTPPVFLQTPTPTNTAFNSFGGISGPSSSNTSTAHDPQVTYQESRLPPQAPAPTNPDPIPVVHAVNAPPPTLTSRPPILPLQDRSQTTYPDPVQPQNNESTRKRSYDEYMASTSAPTLSTLRIPSPTTALAQISSETDPVKIHKYYHALLKTVTTAFTLQARSAMTLGVTKLGEAQRNVQQLEVTNRELRAEADGLKKVLTQLETRVKERESMLWEREGMIRQRDGVLRERESEREVEWSGWIREKEGLYKECNAQKAETDRLRGENEMWRKEVNVTMETMRTLRQDYDSWKSDAEHSVNWRAEAEKTKAEIDWWKNENSQLRTEVEHHKTQAGSWRTAIERFIRQRAEENRAREAKDTVAVHLLVDNGRLQGENARLRKEALEGKTKEEERVQAAEKRGKEWEERAKELEGEASIARGLGMKFYWENKRLKAQVRGHQAEPGDVSTNNWGATDVQNHPSLHSISDAQTQTENQDFDQTTDRSESVASQYSPGPPLDGIIEVLTPRGRCSTESTLMEIKDEQEGSSQLDELEDFDDFDELLDEAPSTEAEPLLPHDPPPTHDNPCQALQTILEYEPEAGLGPDEDEVDFDADPYQTLLPPYSGPYNNTDGGDRASQGVQSEPTGSTSTTPSLTAELCLDVEPDGREIDASHADDGQHFTPSDDTLLGLDKDVGQLQSDVIETRTSCGDGLYIKPEQMDFFIPPSPQDLSTELPANPPPKRRRLELGRTLAQPMKRIVGEEEGVYVLGDILIERDG